MNWAAKVAIPYVGWVSVSCFGSCGQDHSSRLVKRPSGPSIMEPCGAQPPSWSSQTISQSPYKKPGVTHSRQQARFSTSASSFASGHERSKVRFTSCPGNQAQGPTHRTHPICASEDFP